MPFLAAVNSQNTTSLRYFNDDKIECFSARRIDRPDKVELTASWTIDDNFTLQNAAHLGLYIVALTSEEGDVSFVDAYDQEQNATVGTEIDSRFIDNEMLDTLLGVNGNEISRYSWLDMRSNNGSMLWRGPNVPDPDNKNRVTISWKLNQDDKETQVQLGRLLLHAHRIGSPKNRSSLLTRFIHNHIIK